MSIDLTGLSARELGALIRTAKKQQTIVAKRRPITKVRAQLTKLAKTFSSAIEIRADSQDTWVNAKSPNGVMKLKAKHGEILHVQALGEDAQSSVEALIALVERDFDD